jgi:Zn-dependent metalloprotease
MLRSRTICSLVVLLVACAAATAVAVVRPTDAPPPRVPDATVTIDPSKETLIAWDAWRATHPGEWTVRWNPMTGAAQDVFGSGTPARDAAPAAIAREVLLSLAPVVQADPGALVLAGQTFVEGVHHLRYQQQLNGLPVEGAEVLVHLTRSGQVTWVASRYEPQARVASTTPTVAMETATSRVLADLHASVVLSAPQAELVVLPEHRLAGGAPGTFRLAWRVLVSTEGPRGDWLYRVDATSGEILTRDNRIEYTSGTVSGNVFPNVGSDALVTRAMGWEYVTVGGTQVTTDVNGYYTTGATGTISSSLKGPYVNVVNEDAPGATYSSSGGGADYTVGSTTYSWVTASTATGVTGDDQYKAFTLPFTFSFYGTNYTSVNVCSNGFLNFGTGSSSYQPAAIPNTGAPNALIAPLWRDLNPSAGGTIYYSSSGSQFVVLWSGVRNYANSNTQTFEVILKPDGTITYQYQSVTNDVTSVYGVENQAGSAGRTNSTPANGTAVRYTPTTGGGGSSWTWAYGTTDTHVDEVNGFYHVNYIHNYFKSVQGFTGMDYQIKATVHYGTNYANAFYSPSDKNIYFGDGDGVNVLDTAKARDVWYHEYTHGVVDHIYAIGQSGQAGAMSEGMADYFACTNTGDHLLGEWVFPDPRYQRDLQNTLKYPQDWVGEIHDDGRIYSGAVWDFRTAAGATVADKDAFTSFSYAPQDFVSGENAFISADNSIYGGTHVSQIQTAFANHGIGGGGGGGGYTVASTTYSWITTSTATGVTGDDQSKAFTLPFTFTFYGTNYTSVNVCSNGFLNFGTSSTSYTPVAIPNTASPNGLLAALWRDLNPSAGGTITYSSSSSQFVVTYSAVRNYANSNAQTFQVIIKNDGTITFQYQSITTDVSSTIGVESPNGSQGTAWSGWPGNGTAIKFTPSGLAPNSGSLAFTSVATGDVAALTLVGTNPLVGGTGTLRYALPAAGVASLRVYDAEGRLVRTLADGAHAAGARSVVWDGRTAAGQPVRPGVYFARLVAGDRIETRRLVVAR